jgi:hypothetical protein
LFFAGIRAIRGADFSCGFGERVRVAEQGLAGGNAAQATGGIGHLHALEPFLELRRAA